MPRFKFDAQTEESIERGKKRAEHVYQPKLSRHLSHEDRRSYEIAFNPDRVQESIDQAKQKPAWQDSLHEMLFMSASSNPQSIPEVLSLAVLDKDAGGAANRRYGDRLDPYYRTATGAVDEVKLAEDQFILDLESAFYGARGKVPMGFFLDHIDDLAMLGPEYSDTVEQLYAYQQVRQARTETEALQEEEFDLKMQRSMDTRGIGRAKAEAEFVGYERIMDQLRSDQKWTTEQKVQYMKSRQGDGFLDSVSQWFDPEPWMDPERNPEMFEHDFEEARLADLAGEAGMDPEEFRHVQEGFGAKPSGEEAVFETTMDVLGGLGVAMNAGADGIGWLASPIWSDGVGEGFQDRYESVFGPNMSMQSQNKAYKDALNETIGMSDDQFVMQMGLVPAIEAWASLPQVNPEEFNTLMSMAGGDEEFAQDMFTDMVLNDPGIREDFIAQAQEVRNTAEYQLQEMEDENFTAGDALLDLIAVWGEGIENVGTTVATGVEFFRKGKGSEIGFTQFWQDVRDNDTPAGVYGLEGTLTGLGIDLLLGVALDPLTYIFGPRLSASGRMGATTADDVLRMSTHPASNRLLLDVQQVGRGHATGAIAYQTTLDTLAVTGMDELLMAAGRGSVKPITSSRPYLAKFGKVTDDVAYNVIDNLIDPDALSMTAINKAKDRIAANGLHKPVEITINPDTGAHALTSGVEDAVALQLQGIDAIPMTVKVDANFGLMVSDDLAEWSSKLNVVDGHMAVDDLTRLRRYDFDAQMREVATPDAPHPLVEDIAARGVQKPLEVVVDISSSPPKVQLMNGNHRLAAAKAAGLDDVPVNVRIKRRDLDAIPGVEDGRPAPFPAQRDYAPPTVADDLPIAEWAKGIRVDDTLDIDGVRHIRPQRAIGESIYGDVDIELMQSVYRKHLAMGGDPIQGIKTPMATSIGSAVGDMFRTTKAGALGDRVARYMTPINANIRFEFTTTVAKSNINQFGARLYGSVKDAVGWEPWAARVNDFFLRRGELRLAGARQQQRALALMDEMDGAMGFIGGNLDNWSARFGVELDDGIKANHRQVTTYVDDLQRQLDDVVKAQKKMAPDLNNYTELHTLMDEFMADFKKKHIDGNPKWADHLVDGEVPWEALNSQAVDPAQAIAAIAQRANRDGVSLRAAAQSELGYVPKEMDKLLKIADDVNVNKFLDEALHSLNTPTAWVAPASPLEIMAAASGGPRAVKTVIETAAGKKVADGLHTAHTMWMLDKVMTPRTAAVVSLDELMRIWHTGGSRSTFAYLEDKAMGTAARVTRAKTNVNSWNTLPNRWKDRITALEEYPIFYRQLERSFLEPNGVGFDEIVFKKGMRSNDEYYTAARRTAGQLNTDEGFQAFLRGKTAFREWFESAPGAQRLRDIDFFDAALGGRRAGASWTEVYAGYETTFERWALQGIKENKKGAARAEWARAAEAQAAKGSAAGGVAEMPEWVLEGFGRVTGNKQGGTAWKTGVNKISEALFQGPVDYRRGFLAEWVRKSENARLTKLYESQGMRVVTDEEMLQLVKQRYPSVPDEIVQPHLHQLSQEMFEKSGVVTQRYVSELVENKVIQEMENMLYSFHMNSRAGRASKAVAPFGKPWADMWGFWGREIVSRPQLRGYINNTNFANLGQIANKVVDHLPFNPRTTAYMSRLAATDFNMDRIEDDPIVGGLARSIGLDRLDVGPAMFLPKGGENPFMVMLPGLGLVPSAALHAVFRYTAPDPLEEPIEYQAYLDQWSQFIPGLSYNRPTDMASLAATTAVGGGVLSRIASGAQAANLMLSPGLSPGQATLGEDWQARIAADRQVQVVFQDPDIWAELAELPPEMADIGISAYLDEKLMELSKEASQVSGRQQFMEEGLELGVPVRSEFNTQREDLNSVWLESIDWMGLTLPEFYDTGTESGQAEAASWARTAFYKLPDWERDTLVTNHPGLAVNMVSMWEWSDKAKDLGIPDSGKPYRSGGSNQDLKRHETYRQMSLIKPISTRDFAERIIGTVLSARTQTARGLYMETAQQVNDQRWEFVVDDEWKEWLDAAVPVLLEEGHLPYRTGRELWENYSDLEKVFEELFPDADPIGLPGKQRAWGEKMPSDPSALRESFTPIGDDPSTVEDETFEGYPIPRITPQMQRQADSLGIVLERNTMMHEIYGEVANEIAESYLENPIFAYIGPEYKAYLNPRSAGHQATQETLGRVLDHESFEPETVNAYRRVLVYLEEAVDRKAMGEDSWLQVRDEAVADWKRMAQDDAWGDLGPNILNKLWDDAYGSSLGALDWAPDEPAPLRLGANEFNPDASPAFVRRVVDGDTMDVVFETGTIGGGFDTYRVRLLGTNQPELGTDEGYAARDDLNKQVNDAIQAGLPITIVRDPRYGNTDMYGRIFAWVYIGEDAIYAPETMIPRR